MSLNIKNAETYHLVQELAVLTGDTAPRLREPWRSADHGDFLYDATVRPGRPRAYFPAVPVDHSAEPDAP